MKLLDVERKVWSQNGEDGIIEWLWDHRLFDDPPTFVEVAAGNGGECCTRYLAEQDWRGLWVEADPKRALHAVKNHGVPTLQMWVTPDSAGDVAKVAQDALGFVSVLSVDVDSHDFHILKGIFKRWRPTVLCVEYNAAIPPELSLTMPKDGSADNVYHGCSVAALTQLCGPFGLRFLTVCSAGVNAFFYDPIRIRLGIIDPRDWLPWADCPAVAEKHGDAAARWAKIKDMPWEEVL